MNRVPASRGSRPGLAKTLPGLLLVGIVLAATLVPQDSPRGDYVKKDSRSATVRATLRSHGLPNLEGKWYYAGPFDNTDRVGFDTPYPPEEKQDLNDTFVGKG